MKLLFLGDSITDAGRYREEDGVLSSYGCGFVRSIAGRLFSRDPGKYAVVNRGVSADKTVDLYARLKPDVWNEKPDVLTVLVGINDLAFDIKKNTGVGKERFKKVYRAILEETLEVLPKIRILLAEPFMGHGRETDGFFPEFEEISSYAAVVKELAAESGAVFVPLSAALEEGERKYGAGSMLSDGVHPTVAGAERIADEWMKAFKKIEK